MYRHSALSVTLFFLSVVLLACAGLDDSKASYKRGDFENLKALAEQGDPKAQYDLGVMYDWGLGVPQNRLAALKWYRMAADQGNRKAQFNLGVMYRRGQSVPKDYAEALKWYHMAADQGYAWAQFELGEMYRGGEGVPKDDAQAENWYRNAADQGLPDARRALYAYHQEPGVPKDDGKAVKVEQRNADLGVRSVEIPLKKRGGVYELSVKINGVITLQFILDTGASEVTIPADVALTLLRTGTIAQSDFLPGKCYQLADGSVMQSSRFIIRELDLGGIKIAQVSASIVPATASLLLGQSLLARIESWALDNKRHVLIIRGLR